MDLPPEAFQGLMNGLQRRRLPDAGTTTDDDERARDCHVDGLALLPIQPVAVTTLERANGNLKLIARRATNQSWLLGCPLAGHHCEELLSDKALHRPRPVGLPACRCSDHS